MERPHATLLRWPAYHQAPGWRDAVAFALVMSIILLLGHGVQQMVGPFSLAEQPAISISPSALPYYALRTTMRMFAALAASVFFTFTYATFAAKSRHAEIVLIPLLDVLQSVPVLGYLSFTVVFFISLFPNNTLGPELASIFAIFTSQAWNMAFSFYQSLRTIPSDVDEASRSFRFSAWQRFWRLEVPFAMPGLIWNTMMSMSGGWFFVVASEAVSVGDVQFALPGVGSYVAKAIENRDLSAVGYAIAAMAATILLYDQLLFRPLVAWAEKFRFEQTAAQVVAHSWVLDLFQQTKALNGLFAPIAWLLDRIVRARLSFWPSLPAWPASTLLMRAIDAAWFAALALGVAYLIRALLAFVQPTLSMSDLLEVVQSGGLTFLRVAILIVIATLVWVPIGVAIGLRPAVAERIQPIAQFLAAFPVNLLFPVAVFLILKFRLEPNIWLSPLMILGTQWYILFNVVAGASAYPSDLREAAATFRIHGWSWWRKVMLPGVFPYFVTGAITASGGAWNASIVAEAVSWGPTRLYADGLGAYIALATEVGDFPRIALGIAVMSAMVVAMNRLFWRPLYALAERRTRLD